jgi:hypothetical protein
MIERLATLLVGLALIAGVCWVAMYIVDDNLRADAAYRSEIKNARNH